jgi:long-subunit fatty acid transport protein
MKYSTLISRLSALGALIGFAGTAHAAGFEKATSWSGRNAAIGGAAASSVSGPEALFFNPAGIGGEGMGVSAQLSPTWTQAKGPVITAGDELEGERELSPVFGLLGDFGLSEDMAVGIGVFAAGGTKAVYEGVKFDDLNEDFTLKGVAKSELAIVEIAPGFSYRVAPGLRLGATWRASIVKGELASVAYTDLQPLGMPEDSYIAQAITLGDLSGTNFAGFRVGAQWAPEGASWGLGLNVRTPVSFELEGTTSGKAQFMAGGAAAGVNALNEDPHKIDGGDVTVESELPTQVSFGGHFGVSDEVTLFAEYTWTNYKAIKKIDVSGEITTPDDLVTDAQETGLGSPGLAPAVNGQDKKLPDFKTNWNDQHQIRIGSELHFVENLPIRLGYVLTTQVVPDKYARATFSSPGQGHTLTAGFGATVAGVAIDAAVEYSKAAGTGSTRDGGDDNTSSDDTLKGDYSTSAYAAHLGATYRF